MGMNRSPAAVTRMWARSVVAWAFETAERTRLRYRLERQVYEGRVTIGRHTYGTPTVDFYRGSDDRVDIGPFCSIGPDVRIVAGGIHPDAFISLYPFRARFGLRGQVHRRAPNVEG